MVFFAKLTLKNSLIMLLFSKTPADSGVYPAKISIFAFGKLSFKTLITGENIIKSPMPPGWIIKILRKIPDIKLEFFKIYSCIVYFNQFRVYFSFCKKLV